MSQVSRNIFSSRGRFLLLYLTLWPRPRPQTFGLRDRRRSGTKAWMRCKVLYSNQMIITFYHFTRLIFLAIGTFRHGSRQSAVSVALLPRYPNPNSWLVLISFRIFHNVNTNVDDQFDSIKKKKATAELLLLLLVLTLQVWITYGSGSSTVGFNK